MCAYSEVSTTAFNRTCALTNSPVINGPENYMRRLNPSMEQATHLVSNCALRIYLKHSGQLTSKIFQECYTVNSTLLLKIPLRCHFFAKRGEGDQPELWPAAVRGKLSGVTEVQLLMTYQGVHTISL